MVPFHYRKKNIKWSIKNYLKLTKLHISVTSVGFSLCNGRVPTILSTFVLLSMGDLMHLNYVVLACVLISRLQVILISLMRGPAVASESSFGGLHTASVFEPSPHMLRGENSYF